MAYSANAFIGFVMGAVVGAAASAIFLKKKYEDDAKAEVDSFKDMYERKIARLESKLEESQSPKELVINQDALKLTEKQQEDANRVLDRLMFPTQEDAEEREEYEREAAMYGSIEPVPNMNQNAYTIPADAFDELLDYECFDLTYYSDGIVADDRDIPLDDVERVIGDALDHFGDYDDPEVVYVRNDALRCDYEIFKDPRTYAEMKGDLGGD